MPSACSAVITGWGRTHRQRDTGWGPGRREGGSRVETRGTSIPAGGRQVQRPGTEGWAPAASEGPWGPRAAGRKETRSGDSEEPSRLRSPPSLPALLGAPGPLHRRVWLLRPGRPPGGLGATRAGSMSVACHSVPSAQAGLERPCDRCLRAARASDRHWAPSVPAKPALVSSTLTAAKDMRP